MNGLSLCSGVGGLELGLRLAIGPEYRCVGFIEKRLKARRCLARNLPAFGGAAAFGDDIISHDFYQWRGCVDILSAGWPCQGFSTASRGRPTHPDLWFFVRRAIFECQPSFVFLENVDRAPWAMVQSDLEDDGFRVARGRFCPSYLGAPFRRSRTFLLAHANGDSKSLVPVDVEMACVLEASGVSTGARPGPMGMDDDAPTRMDRLELLGEGVVTVVAAHAWRTLMARLAIGDPEGADLEIH